MRTTPEHTLARNLIKSFNFKVGFEVMLRNAFLKAFRRYSLLSRF